VCDLLSVDCLQNKKLSGLKAKTTQNSRTNSAATHYLYYYHKKYEILGKHRRELDAL